MKRRRFFRRRFERKERVIERIIRIVRIYEKFRTGLTFTEVRRLLSGESKEKEKREEIKKRMFEKFKRSLRKDLERKTYKELYELLRSSEK